MEEEKLKAFIGSKQSGGTAGSASFQTFPLKCLNVNVLI